MYQNWIYCGDILHRPTYSVRFQFGIFLGVGAEIICWPKTGLHSKASGKSNDSHLSLYCRPLDYFRCDRVAAVLSRHTALDGAEATVLRRTTVRHTFMQIIHGKSIHVLELPFIINNEARAEDIILSPENTTLLIF